MFPTYKKPFKECFSKNFEDLGCNSAPHIQLLASERIQRHNSTHCKISVSLHRWASSWRRPNQFPRDVEVDDGVDEDIVDVEVVDDVVEVFHKHDADDEVL